MQKSMIYGLIAAGAVAVLLIGGISWYMLMGDGSGIEKSHAGDFANPVPLQRLNIEKPIANVGSYDVDSVEIPNAIEISKMQTAFMDRFQGTKELDKYWKMHRMIKSINNNAASFDSKYAFLFVWMVAKTVHGWEDIDGLSWDSFNQIFLYSVVQALNPNARVDHYNIPSFLSQQSLSDQIYKVNPSTWDPNYASRSISFGISNDD